MSINPEQAVSTHYDEQGNPLPPMEVRSPEPNFGNDEQGARIREANRLAEAVQESNSRFSMKQKIGAGIAGLVITGGALLGLKAAGGEADKGDAIEPVNSDSSVGAPANPGDNADSNDGAPTDTSEDEPPEVDVPAGNSEAQVGIPGDNLDNISVKPSPELVQEALKPVTVAEYPTAEEALVQFGKIENVILNSGTVEAELDPNSGSNATLVPESYEEAEKLWGNMLSDEGHELSENMDVYNWINDLREPIAMEHYLSTLGSFSETMTFHHDWEVNFVKDDTTEAGYVAEVVMHTFTNVFELDEYAPQSFGDLTSDHTTTVTVRIHNDGERWFIDDMNGNATQP